MSGPSEPQASALEPIDGHSLTSIVGGNRMVRVLEPLLRRPVVGFADTWTFQPNGIGRLLGLSRSEVNTVQPHNLTRWFEGVQRQFKP